MAERGGQPGNSNAKNSRLIQNAFLREIKARDLKDGDGETLRKIAAKFIDKAIGGDVNAFAAIRDTVDGRPAMAIDVTGDVTHRYVAELPSVASTADEWKQRVQAKLPAALNS